MQTPIPLSTVEPMQAKRSASLPRTGQWHYEIKYDGYRLLAQPFPPRLRTFKEDATRWFPELAEALSSLPVGAHILDGEVAVLDEVGRSDFGRLHARALRRRWYRGADPVVYCVFDLLVHAGVDLRGEPIEVRKAQLRQLLAGVDRGLLFVDSDTNGRWLFDAVVQLQMEGVVAKRQGSRYVGGVSPDWLKIKPPGWKGGFNR